MKKIYLGLGIVALTANVVAQNRTNVQESPMQLRTTEIKEARKQYAAYEKASVTLWSDNFDDVTKWTIDNAGLASPLGWSIGTVENSWAFTTRINSTSGGNFAQLNNGDPNPGGTPAPAAATYRISTTSRINVDSLSGGLNTVSIQFQQYGAKFQDLQEVYVSTNGTTWTLVGDNEDIPALTANGGAPYANPMTRKFNITSAIASNPDSVWIRFSWSPNAQNITYGWMIDDVKIVTNENSELNILSSNFGSTGFWSRMPYYRVPFSQITDVDFATVVRNAGAANQPNTKLTVDINSGSASVVSPAGFTSIAGTDDTLVTAPYLITNTTTAATYNFSMLVSSDSVEATPANNVATASMATNQFIYSRDIGVSAGAASNQNADYELGNMFDIFADATAHAIQVKVSNTSTGNPILYGTIYSVDPNDGSFIFYETTEEYTLTNQQRASGATINLVLQNPAFLAGGSSYVVVVGSYNNTTDNLAIQNGGTSDPQTSFINDGVGTTWFFTTSTPMVRLNFDGAVSVGEEIVEAASLGQNFPNPAKSITSVEYTLTSNEAVTFEITDANGKVIEVINEGNKTAGTYVANINVSKLSAGTYFYSLITNSGKVTKSMNVVK